MNENPKQMLRLLREKALFEQSLYDAIQGAVHDYMGGGGIHPKAIEVTIARDDVFGHTVPEYRLHMVKVDFGL